MIVLILRMECRDAARLVCRWEKSRFEWSDSPCKSFESRFLTSTYESSCITSLHGKLFLDSEHVIRLPIFHGLRIKPDITAVVLDFDLPYWFFFYYLEFSGHYLLNSNNSRLQVNENRCNFMMKCWVLFSFIVGCFHRCWSASLKWYEKDVRILSTFSTVHAVAGSRKEKSSCVVTSITHWLHYSLTLNNG